MEIHGGNGSMDSQSQEVATGWNTAPLKWVGLWFTTSLAVSLVFLPELRVSLGAMLSPDWLFGQQQVSSWGVLGLCGIWLWLKRKAIWKEMGAGQSLVLIPLGLAMVAASILLPFSRDFLVFQVLLALLGVFIIFFGRAAQIPTILLGIYGFTVSFPLLIERFAEEAYSQIAIVPLMGLMAILSYPIENQGQLIHFTTSSGDSIVVALNAACAGPATMGVFIAIFALMTLDIPLPPKKAAYMFLFGVAGTWIQSFFRLIILMLVGYYWGEAALWTAHLWTPYFLFPLWYLLFAYIYFRQAGPLRRVRAKANIQMERST
jgi:exosortase/archaeosortase family protein